MKNVIKEFGENAGKVWQVLHDQGPLQQTKLIRTVKLTEDELYTAIGWLARENKINKNDTSNGTTYMLGETNLTKKIGTDAGKIWKTLHSLGENNITELSKLTQLKKEELHAALGWLARENKIQLKHENRELIIHLNGT
jgi:Winged helix-turn-helix domain (DUF2582)